MKDSKWLKQIYNGKTTRNKGFNKLFYNEKKKHLVATDGLMLYLLRNVSKGYAKTFEDRMEDRNTFPASYIKVVAQSVFKYALDCTVVKKETHELNPECFYLTLLLKSGGTATFIADKKLYKKLYSGFTNPRVKIQVRPLPCLSLIECPNKLTGKLGNRIGLLVGHLNV